MIERDPSLLSVLDRYTPSAANDYPLDWNDVLRRAQPLDRRSPVTPRRRRVSVAGAILVAAATAVALLVATPWSTPPDIVGRAEAALTLPPRTVLHIEVRDTHSELGAATTTTWDMWFNKNGGYRGVTDLSGSPVEFGGGTTFRQSVQYNPATNIIGPAAVNRSYTAFGNPQDEIRKELAANAHVDGEAIIDGRRLLRIRIQDVDEHCKPTISYLFVDVRAGRTEPRAERHAAGYHVPRLRPSARDAGEPPAHEPQTDAPNRDGGADRLVSPSSSACADVSEREKAIKQS